MLAGRQLKTRLQLLLISDLWQQLAANSLYFEQRALSVGDSSPGKPDRISPGGLLGCVKDVSAPATSASFSPIAKNGTRRG